MAKIDTPCIGVCSTVYGDDICRGCKRTYQEVIDWFSLTAEEKAEIYDRLDADKQTVVSQFLTVEDPHKLKAALDNWHIRYRDEDSPYSWAWMLLMFADTKITDFAEVGLAIQPAYQPLDPTTLCNTLDRALFAHAQHHNAA